MKDSLLVLASILQSLSALGIVVSFWIYRRQRQNTLESEKLANRSRLTEAYMNWHSEILNSEHNTRLATHMLRRSYRINRREDIEQTREIHLLYMLFNVLFLEWSYCEAYKLSKNGFFATVDGAVWGLATHNNPEIRVLMEDFESIFFDFPTRFKADIRSRINFCKQQAQMPHGAN